MIDVIVFSLIGLGLLFCFIRFFKGPSLSDRVVALDTINIIIIGVIAMLSLVFENNLYLDIAIIYAILAFLETVLFSKYVEVKTDENN